MDLHFSMNALLSAIGLCRKLDRTDQVEQTVRDCFASSNMPSLSEAVCTWGGSTGHRVLGNLNRHAGVDPDTWCALKTWLCAAEHAADARTAIDGSVAIKGLGVSYASKHLRLLFPERYAVLDSLICERFGFAMNPSGYQLFMNTLQRWQQSSPSLSRIKLGDLEGGLFHLIREGLPLVQDTVHRRADADADVNADPIPSRPHS